MTDVPVTGNRLQIRPLDQDADELNGSASDSVQVRHKMMTSKTNKKKR